MTTIISVALALWFLAALFLFAYLGLKRSLQLCSSAYARLDHALHS